MVFRAKGTHRYKVRVTGKHSRSRIFSTGTDDKKTAEDVGRMVASLRARRKWEFLDLILDGKVSLPDAYDAYVANRLDDVMATAIGEASELDLDPLVTEWKTRGATAVYVRMVRSLVVEGTRFPLSAFRRRAISDHLASLNVGVVTKRKYRVAFSMFARWLIERELLDTNPARDVSLGRAPTKVLSFLEPEQQKALIPTLRNEEQRALEALMAGSGIEWQAALRLHGRDIDGAKRMVHAYGSKNQHRDRWVEVTEDWCWDIFWRYAKTLTPNAPAFPHCKHTFTIEHHQVRSAALGLPKTTLHQYRHAFAVMWIRRGATGGLREDGRDKQWLKNQLGHAPESTMLDRIYGVHIKAARMSEQQKKRMGVTAGATDQKGLREVKRAKR